MPLNHLWCGSIDITYLALNGKIINRNGWQSQYENKIDQTWMAKKYIWNVKIQKKKTPQTLRPKELFSFYLEWTKQTTRIEMKISSLLSRNNKNNISDDKLLH